MGRGGGASEICVVDHVSEENLSYKNGGRGPPSRSAPGFNHKPKHVISVRYFPQSNVFKLGLAFL